VCEHPKLIRFGGQVVLLLVGVGRQFGVTFRIQ
jgi:hypothetical protein